MVPALAPHSIREMFRGELLFREIRREIPSRSRELLRAVKERQVRRIISENEAACDCSMQSRESARNRTMRTGHAARDVARTKNNARKIDYFPSAGYNGLTDINPYPSSVAK